MLECKTLNARNDEDEKQCGCRLLGIAGGNLRCKYSATGAVHLERDLYGGTGEEWRRCLPSAVRDLSWSRSSQYRCRSSGPHRGNFQVWLEGKDPCRNLR